MEINDSTFDSLKTMYHDIIDDACKRAIDLSCDGFVAEFETLIEMTTKPYYQIELAKIMNDVMDKYHASHGLRTALRITPNDTREMKRPPYMRSGELLDKMVEAFDGTTKAGAEMLSIESTGGKEIHDEALLNCDIAQVIFALGIMGCRDMNFLWGTIVDVARKNNTVAGGDTACGFGNTAMVLADRRFIPKVFAAVVRAATAPRSLVAYDKGAVGPGKDCGYENVYLRAITGFPMAMEGKTAACAHFSPVGNIASAMCDTWSNESVQNVKLLAGMAPTCYFEQLVYDCRLMNTATAKDQQLMLRDLLVDSDAKLDPQAYVLTPASTIAIARSIVSSADYYRATKNACLTAIQLIKDGLASGAVQVHENDLPYLDVMESTVGGLPESEGEFINQMMAVVDTTKFRPAEYGL